MQPAGRRLRGLDGRDRRGGLVARGDLEWVLRDGTQRGVVVLVDEPDHKKVTWIDEHGAELEIGAQKALVPAVYGACVLP